MPNFTVGVHAISTFNAILNCRSIYGGKMGELHNFYVRY